MIGVHGIVVLGDEKLSNELFLMVQWPLEKNSPQVIGISEPQGKTSPSNHWCHWNDGLHWRIALILF